MTEAARGKVPENYHQFLDKNGLKGARIGVLREVFDPAETDPEILKLMNQALEDMKKAGANIIDPVTVGNIKEIRDGKRELGPLRRFGRHGVTLGPTTPTGTGDNTVGRRGEPAPGQPDAQDDPYSTRAQRNAPSVKS